MVTREHRSPERVKHKTVFDRKTAERQGGAFWLSRNAENAAISGVDLSYTDGWWPQL